MGNRIVHSALDFLEARNTTISQNSIDKRLIVAPIFARVGTISYPVSDDGEIIGMVHGELQGRDFMELKDGAPLFLHMDGSTHYFWRGEHGLPLDVFADAVHPIFINE